MDIASVSIILDYVKLERLLLIHRLVLKLQIEPGSQGGKYHKCTESAESLQEG